MKTKSIIIDTWPLHHKKLKIYKAAEGWVIAQVDIVRLGTAQKEVVITMVPDENEAPNNAER